MGNSGAKKTNQLLEQQRNRYINPFGDEMRGYGREERGYGTGTRDWITSRYQDLYNTLGESGDGGGGGGFSPTISDARMNEAMPFYREAMSTGLFSPEQINDFRARIGMQNASTFGGLQRQLAEGANIRGGGFAGYSGQRALLARDRARELERARVEGELGLQNEIRGNRFRGGEGVGKYDTEYMNNLRMVENMRNQAGASAAARRGSAADDEFRRRMSILGELRGLRGEQGTDLPYFGLAGREYGEGLNAINSRREETPWWKEVAGVAAPIAGAFFGGGVPKLPKKKVYAPGPGDMGDY